MNEIINEEIIPEGKIYKGKAFWVGSFLGGPLVIGYLFAENFKVLGQPEKIKWAWIISIVSTIVIFYGAFEIPENINFPNQIIPITYTLIAYGLFKKFQEEKVNEHIKRGGVLYSWEKIIGVSIIGLLVTLGTVFGIVYASDTIKQANISTKTYGMVVKHEIDYDTTNISEQEVDEIAAGFRETGFFDFSMAKYVYVYKNKEGYEITIPIFKGTENSTTGLQPFIELRDQMDTYFPNKSIEIKLAVDYLENVVKVLK